MCSMCSSLGSMSPSPLCDPDVVVIGFCCSRQLHCSRLCVLLDSIALADLGSAGREVLRTGCLSVVRSLPRWLPHNGSLFKIKSRLHTRTRVLEPKWHSHDICGNACTVCVCVVCVMSLHHTSVYVRNVSISLPNNGSPRDK